MNAVTQGYIDAMTMTNMELAKAADEIKALKAELGRWEECADRLAVAITSEAIARAMHPGSPEVMARKFRSAEAVDLYLTLANERAGKRNNK